jgi:hypothetical protein
MKTTHAVDDMIDHALTTMKYDGQMFQIVMPGDIRWFQLPARNCCLYLQGRSDTLGTEV